MARFHIAHMIPHPRAHGLYGYKEIIETISWGLEQLGHEVTYAVNNFASDVTNIVFGAQVTSIDVLKTLPEHTIIYNFEQMRGLSPNEIKPEVKYCASHFNIWDYSASNTDTWRALGGQRVRVVPVGYAPILSRIPKHKTQDIDVLIYGLTGQKRLGAFHALAQSGLIALFVCGLYGPARDGLISRSKIVLNINLYQHSKIFEIVRVSYLLANRKAVLSDLDPDTYIENDIKNGIKFFTPQTLVDDCYSLLENESDRARLEEAGFQAISKRDIRDILHQALE
ncbi:MAG: hypothetical protein HY272_10550 [Gammaproteobacteria bacterium]|nr:hypothetical protein [Gammaproteobacteria bacterium]